MSISEKVKELNLPKNSFIVVGSGTLKALGIRDTNDIDMVVTKEVYARLKAEGWREEFHDDGTSVVLHDVYDAGVTWGDPGGKPNLQDLLSDALWHEDIPYVNLDRVLAWKRRMGREKDLLDIELIEQYQKRAKLS